MLASGVAAGLVIGLVFRRSWKPLITVDIHWFPLLVVGLLARVVAPALPVFAFPLYVFAIAATAASAFANIRLFGAGAIGLGAGLNLAVVMLNHGMPVDPAAVVAAHTTMPRDGLHVVLTAATQLPALGDVISVGLFPGGVYSVGDFFIAVGGFLVPFVLLIRR